MESLISLFQRRRIKKRRSILLKSYHTHIRARHSSKGAWKSRSALSGIPELDFRDRHFPGLLKKCVLEQRSMFPSFTRHIIDGDRYRSTGEIVLSCSVSIEFYSCISVIYLNGPIRLCDDTELRRTSTHRTHH